MSKSIYRGIIKEVGVITLANLGNSLSGIALLPAFTKYLGAYDYGLYVQITVSISLIMGFVTLGLPYTAVRFLSSEKDKKVVQDDVYSSLVLILAFSLFTSIIFLFLSDKLSQLLFDGQITLALIFAILIPVEAILWALVNLFRAFHEIKKFAIFSVIRTYSELAIIISIILLGYGIIQILEALLLLRGCLLAIMLFYTISHLGFILPTFARMKEYLRFSLPTIPGNIAAWVTDSSDRYLIGIFLGTSFVGYYNPGYNLGTIISMFMLPINFVLVSSLSKYYDNNEINLVRNIFKYSTKYFLMLAIPASFGVSVLSLPILKLLTTSEIAQMSYLITPLIAFSSLFYCIGGGIIFFSLYLAKKTKIIMINWILVAFINIILNILLIPRTGILGAASATLISQIIGFMFGVYFSCKYFKFEIDYLSILKIVFSSIIMALLIINPIFDISYLNGIEEIILQMFLGMCIYFLSIISMRTICTEEISFLKSLLHVQKESIA